MVHIHHFKKESFHFGTSVLDNFFYLFIYRNAKFNLKKGSKYVNILVNDVNLLLVNITMKR